MGQYIVMLTKVGESKLGQAFATKTIIDMYQLALGDGLGKDVVPNKNQFVLNREVWRGDITKVSQDPLNPNYVVVETTVPSTAGGWTVREVGIYDRSGDLIVVGNYPPTFKPISSAGAAKTLTIKLTLKFTTPSSSGSVAVFDKPPSAATNSGIEIHVGNAIFSGGTVSLIPGTGVDLQADAQAGIVMISAVLGDWAPGFVYKKGSVVYYNGCQYRCRSAHTAPDTFDTLLWETVATSQALSGQPIDPNAIYYYDIAGACFGKPDSTVELMRFVAVRPFRILTNFPDSQACANVGPYYGSTMSLFINNKEFAQITFPPSSTGLPSYGKFTSQEDTYFAVKDILTVTSPEVQDAQMTDIEWTLVGQLVSA